MSYIKTLYTLNYDFSKLPADLKTSCMTILQNKEYNSKIERLDAVCLKSIRNTQPTDERVEKLYAIYLDEDNTQNNNGFNTKFAIDESEELFMDDHPIANSQIPDEYEIVEIVFDRNYFKSFAQSNEWLRKFGYNIRLPKFEDDGLQYIFSEKPIKGGAKLDIGVVAYLTTK